PATLRSAPLVERQTDREGNSGARAARRACARSLLESARMQGTPFIPAKAGIQKDWVPATGSPRRKRRGVPRAGTNGLDSSVMTCTYGTQNEFTVSHRNGGHPLDRASDGLFRSERHGIRPRVAHRAGGALQTLSPSCLPVRRRGGAGLPARAAPAC